MYLALWTESCNPLLLISPGQSKSYQAQERASQCWTAEVQVIWQINALGSGKDEVDGVLALIGQGWEIHICPMLVIWWNICPMLVIWCNICPMLVKLKNSYTVPLVKLTDSPSLHRVKAQLEKFTAQHQKKQSERQEVIKYISYISMFPVHFLLQGIAAKVCCFQVLQEISTSLTDLEVLERQSREERSSQSSFKVCTEAIQ